MNKIQLINALPQVFRGRASTESDIWQNTVTLEKGKFHLVEANSGTGKSSLCSFIYGYRNDYDGDILFDNEDIRKYDMAKWSEIRKTHLSILWQELRLFPELSAWENIAIKNNITHYQTEAQITAWLEQLGIADKRDALIGRMSYGQQQRVALIRTLCQPADFIFADEPISHLDEKNSQIMVEILTQEAKKQGAGVIATSIGKRLELDYDVTLKL